MNREELDRRMRELKKEMNESGYQEILKEINEVFRKHNTNPLHAYLILGDFRATLKPALIKLKIYKDLIEGLK